MKVWITHSNKSYKIESVYSNKDAAIRSLMDYYEPLLRSKHWSESQLRKHAEMMVKERELIDEY